MASDTSPDKILVLLKACEGSDHHFLCPHCGMDVITLKGCEVADMTDPETYALANVMGQSDELFTAQLKHQGRLGEGFCRRKFFFWDVNQRPVGLSYEVHYAA